MRSPFQAWFASCSFSVSDWSQTNCRIQYRNMVHNCVLIGAGFLQKLYVHVSSYKLLRLLKEWDDSATDHLVWNCHLAV